MMVVIYSAWSAHTMLIGYARLEYPRGLLDTMNDGTDCTNA